VRGVSAFSDVADYIVINVSSPNTTGLRDLQQKRELEQLIQKVCVEAPTELHSIAMCVCATLQLFIVYVNRNNNICYN